MQEVLDFSSDPGSMVVAFNILYPAEKAYAFKKHISDSYKGLELNAEQLEFVKSTIEMIVPEMYMEDKREDYAGIVAKFEYQAAKLFSEKDYFSLFEKIQTKEITPNNPSGGNDCTCRSDGFCQAYAGTLGPSCNWGNCIEVVNCGFLSMFNCKGKCGPVLP